MDLSRPNANTPSSRLVSVPRSGPGMEISRRDVRDLAGIPGSQGSMPPVAGRAEEPPTAASALRVLVIEDNVDAAESLRDVLELDGYEAAIAYDGPRGVEAARSFQPHAVLCDIGLPGGMDGYAVARALRAHQALRSVYLIALTGYDGPEDRKQAREAGFDAHVTKPPDLEALERILSGVASRG